MQASSAPTICKSTIRKEADCGKVGVGLVEWQRWRPVKRFLQISDESRTTDFVFPHAIEIKILPVWPPVAKCTNQTANIKLQQKQVRKDEVECTTGSVVLVSHGAKKGQVHWLCLHTYAIDGSQQS